MIIMRNIKIKNKYLILIVLTLIVSTSTLTFSYFKGDVLNETVNNTQVTTGNIDIEISDTSVSVKNVKPLYTNGNNYDKATFKKSFSVTSGADSLNICTELYLRINSIDSNLANSYFRYAVVNDDTGTTITGDFDGTVDGSEIDLGSLYFFEKEVTKNYTMYIWIEYDGDNDQSSMLNKSMNATLYVVARDSKTKDTCDTRTDYKITYALNGGSGCSNETVSKGGTVSLCTPTNKDSGLVFGGWFTDTSYSKEVSLVSDVSDDIKLYAMWTCSSGSVLVQGTEYINGQYVYRYMQEGALFEGLYESGSSSINIWSDISEDGWGVQLNNKGPGDDNAKCTNEADCGDLIVTSKVCNFIDKKPVVSMANMFSNSRATTVDFSSYNTKLVTSMNSMFYNTKIESFDLSSFDLNDNVDLTNMFVSAIATSAYAKNREIANKFNEGTITGIQDSLKFTVK